MPAHTDLPFDPRAVIAASAPLVRISLGEDGRPVAARAAMLVEAEPERVWDVVSDVESYAERVPMIHRARLDGDRVKMDLRFRISLFSVTFSFEARESHDEGRWVEIAWVSGEPRDLRIRYDLVPVDGATVLYSSIGFDISSLGWLVKFFLKHHPEIQYGVYPGSALVLLDTMNRAARGA